MSGNRLQHHAGCLGRRADRAFTRAGFQKIDARIQTDQTRLPDVLVRGEFSRFQNEFEQQPRTGGADLGHQSTGRSSTRLAPLPQQCPPGQDQIDLVSARRHDGAHVHEHLFRIQRAVREIRDCRDPYSHG